MILDTHVWFWFVTGNKNLTPRLASRIERAATSVKIPSIVFWEFHVLVERGRLTLKNSALDFIARADKTFPFTVEPLTRDIALAARSLSFAHEDPADRFIAATAACLNEPLVTRDSNLLSRPWLKTIEA